MQNLSQLKNKDHHIYSKNHAVPTDKSDECEVKNSGFAKVEIFNEITAPLNSLQIDTQNIRQTHEVKQAQPNSPEVIKTDNQGNSAISEFVNSIISSGLSKISSNSDNGARPNSISGEGENVQLNGQNLPNITEKLDSKEIPTDPTDLSQNLLRELLPSDQNKPSINLAPKYNNFLERHIENFNALIELNKSSDQSLIEKIGCSITQFIGESFRSHIETKYSALRSQEQLMRAGSMLFLQREAFISALSQKKSLDPPNGFNKLSEEMKSLADDGVQTYCEISPLRPFWADNKKNDIKNMKEGQSIWIDVGTKGHCMLLRVTKEVLKDGTNSYILQHANTGAGIPGNHPKVNLPDGKVLYQTVIEFAPVSEEILLNSNFLKDLEDARYERVSQKDLGKAEFGEPLGPINGLYNAYKLHLGEPATKTYPEDSQYFSKPQMGGSCVPSAMWAMSKIILSPNEFHELRQDMRMESLVKNYRNIKNGWDCSSTAKLLVLDNIQRIKGQMTKYEQEIPEELPNIERELLSNLDMKYVEMKRSHPLKFNSSSLQLEKIDSPGPILVEPVIVKFNAKKDSLKYNVTLDKNEFMKEKYSIGKFDNSGRLKGDNFCDNLYLLYFNTAKGKNEAINHYLIILLSSPEFENICNYNRSKKTEIISKKMQKIIEDKQFDLEANKYSLKFLSFAKRISPEDPDKIAHFERTIKELELQIKKLNGEPQFNEDLSKINQTAMLLTYLALEFSKIDKTRSGIAKAYFLANLAASMDSRNRNIRNTVNFIKESFHNLDVEFYLHVESNLGEDNIWLQGLQKLGII